MSNSDYTREMLEALSKNLKKSPEEITSSAQSGNIESLLSSLNKKQRDKVNSILNNPEETQKIISDPRVQELIKKLGGNG